MSSTNPQSFNFCPHCGTDIKDTGYEQFGCWSCGHSVNSDNKPDYRPRIDKEERLLRVLCEKMTNSTYGFVHTFMKATDRLSKEALEEYQRKESEYLEFYISMFRKDTPRRSGAWHIAKERNRQINEEGWTPEHDDQHTDGQLAAAAAVYADQANYSGEFDRVDAKGKCDVLIPRDFKWPWDKEWFKPTPDDRIRELSKAGALIAAEIDREIRKKERNDAD